MQIQLYLSPEAQEHFGISPQEMLTDSEAPLSSDWRALWRCEHLISTEDAEEHLFMLTNAVSGYSMILVDRTQRLDTLMEQFQQTLMVAFCEHGMEFPTKDFGSEVQLLHELEPQFCEKRDATSDAAIDSLSTNGIDIDATERFINQEASKTLRAKLSKTQSTPQETEILSFPAGNKAIVGRR